MMNASTTSGNHNFIDRHHGGLGSSSHTSQGFMPRAYRMPASLRTVKSKFRTMCAWIA